MYWLLGLAVVGVLGYLAVKKTEAAAQNVVNQLGAGGIITTISITPQTTQGDQGPTPMRAQDTLIMQGYPPPAGYAWGFSSDTLAVTVSADGNTGTFKLPAGITTGTAHATLMSTSQSGVAQRPLGIYTTAVTLTA